MIKRTHTCGSLSIKDLKQIISLNGWISKSRDLGGLIFIDLKDDLIKQKKFQDKTTNMGADEKKVNLIFIAVKFLYLKDKYKLVFTDKLELHHFHFHKLQYMVP